jgi:hypothetical protein
MCAGAGPFPVLSFGYEGSTDWIQLRVTERFPEMRLIQGTGVEPALPNMATGMMGGIPVGSVPAVCVLQGPGEGVRLRRRHDEMDMVGHQTVAEERQAVHLNALTQEIKINLAVRIAVKDEPSRVPALRHVVRHSDGHHPSQTRHNRHLEQSNAPVHHASCRVNFFCVPH